MSHEAVNTKPEAFIPFRRRDLIEICLKDQRLDAEMTNQFREFCQILAAYFHFRAHATLEPLTSGGWKKRGRSGSAPGACGRGAWRARADRSSGAVRARRRTRGIESIRRCR